MQLPVAKIKVLILGLGVNGLGIVRTLHGNPNVELWAACFGRKELGRFTRLAKVLHWSDPSSDPQSFLVHLQEWSDTHGTTVLFPTRDTEVELLAEFSSQLPSSLIFYRNSIDQVNALCDKILAVELASRAGLLAPQTIAVTSADPLLYRELRYPALIKPNGLSYEQFPHKNLLVKDEEELSKTLSLFPLLQGRGVVQEYIPGGDDQIYQCNALFGARSECLVSVEFHKIRQYPTGRGIASYGHTTSGKQLEPFCRRLAEATGYAGLMSTEFKRDIRDGRMYFMESNLRLPAYSAVFRECGVNLAYLYVRTLVDRAAPKISPPRTSMWMNEDTDLAQVLTRTVDTGIRDWFRQAARTDAFAFNRKNDPLPGMVWLARFIVKAGKRYMMRS